MRYLPKSETPWSRIWSFIPSSCLSTPWLEVAVDLIGPWSIKVNSQELVIHALTCIDTVTTLAEVICIENKTSAHISMLFENHWLS